MIALTIDNQKVTVEAGTTILQAAQSAGIEIPTLCHKAGFKPSTSCMVCVIRVEGFKTLVPACGMRVSEHMNVTTRSDEILQARTAAIELLLSDHTGDCMGPCEIGCPANMDIPAMLRQIAAGDLAQAIRTIKKDIPLPAVLGRICPAPCEKVCRRAGADGAVSICLLKRFAADADMASASPYQPVCKPPTGHKVAVVGAGPAGLSAACYLRQGGVECHLFDEHPHPGGALRYAEIDRDLLPLSVVEKETEILLSGIQFWGNTQLGRDVALSELVSQYDAVVLAIGAEISAATIDVPAKNGKIFIDRRDYSVAGLKNVFAAGACTGSRNLCVRAVADGKEAAWAILRRLRGIEKPDAKQYNHRLGRVDKDLLDKFMRRSSQASRLNPARLGTGYTPEEADGQAQRCLHCDCGKKDNCGLRQIATESEAGQKTWQGEVSAAGQPVDGGPVRYEAEKCIKCGLCVQAARKAGEKIGLAFEGRGFEMRIAVPFEIRLAESLADPEKCVSVCPTGALTLRSKA